MKPKENASYPYTAIDKFSRWHYVEAFEEHSTCSSMIFPVHLVQAFPMPMECVQTDNGTEFTKRFNKASLDEDLTLFERKIKGIWKSPKDTLHDFINHGITYV